MVLSKKELSEGVKALVKMHHIWKDITKDDLERFSGEGAYLRLYNIVKKIRTDDITKEALNIIGLANHGKIIRGESLDDCFSDAKDYIRTVEALNRDRGTPSEGYAKAKFMLFENPRFRNEVVELYRTKVIPKLSKPKRSH